MKRRLTKIQDVQQLALEGKNYGEVFETGDGEFAVLWGTYPTVTVILPSEFELDKWGDVMNPFEVSREGSTHPLITESNLEFDGRPVFNWCTLVTREDERTWLRLCEPKDATHALIYRFGKVCGRRIAPNDNRKLYLQEDYHEDSELDSTLLLPVGYIKLYYYSADDAELNYVLGANKDMLQEHYANRAKDYLATAQEKLEKRRSARETQAEEIKKSQQFIAEHAEELKGLQKLRQELADQVSSLEEQTLHPDAYKMYTSKIRTGLDKSAANGTKMYGYGKYFDFSEQGIKGLSDLIQAKKSELENILERLRKERQAQEDLIATKDYVFKEVVSRHVCVRLASTPDRTYLSNSHGNYQKIHLDFDMMQSCVRVVDAQDPSTEWRSLSDENCYEQVIHDVDMAIIQSKEYVCKAYFWIQKLFHHKKNGSEED